MSPVRFDNTSEGEVHEKGTRGYEHMCFGIEGDKHDYFLLYLLCLCGPYGSSFSVRTYVSVQTKVTPDRKTTCFAPHPSVCTFSVRPYKIVGLVWLFHINQ